MGTCAKEFLLKSNLVLEHIISNWLMYILLGPQTSQFILWGATMEKLLILLLWNACIKSLVVVSNTLCWNLNIT